MVALPDTHMPDTPLKRMETQAPIEETHASNPARRAILACLGVAMMLAAIGVWIVPVDAGDTAMRLVKLVFSVSMLLMGMILISVLDHRHAEPEIHVDPKSRQLRIIELDRKGTPRLAGEFNLDDLSDISVRDRHLTARDVSGEKIVSVPVHNAAAERAIREALRQAV